MWSLAWPWALLALPLPILFRILMPEAKGLSEAGLRVPSIDSFSTLQDRSGAEQIFNWRFWIAVSIITMRTNDLKNTELKRVR